VSATGGARSDRGWGEVSGTSNRDGECRDSVFSAPDLVKLRRLSSFRRATFERAWQSSQPLIPVVRDVRAVLGRARESIHLQKSYERTRPRRRTRTAGGQRSSRCFRTSMKMCSAEFAGQRRRRAPRTSKERSLGSRSMEGTQGLERPVALTWTGWRRLRRQASGRSRSAPSLAKVSEGSIWPGSRSPKKRRRSPREKCSGTDRGGQSTRSRQRAVKHGAVGG
jgi:hypothetical protein